MSPEQITARERAEAAIARAEATLATPRPTGPLHEAPAMEMPPIVPTQRAEPRTNSSGWNDWFAQNHSHFFQQSIEPLMRMLGEELGSQFTARDDRIAELEKRLASVEATLARAQGKQQ